MNYRTPRYTALLLTTLATTAVAAPALASRQSLASPVNLVPQELDVAQVSQQMLTFDVLVAGAEQAAQQDAAASRQLAHNGLTVAERPMGFSVREARALWRNVSKLSRNDKRQALALLQKSDVVTTEAHALLLEMVGPAPTFAPHTAPVGLSGRQMAWVSLAPQLSELMQKIYRDGQVASLYRQLAPALSALQPTPAELAAHVQLLDKTMGKEALPQERVAVIVVPLMAKDTGATLMLGHNGALTLLGPAASKEERDTLVLHEMLHPRIASLIAGDPSLHQAIDQSACLRDVLRHADGNRAVSQVYDAWTDYLAESWVRGLSHKLTHSLESDDGFALANVLGKLGGNSDLAAPLAARTAATLRQLTARMCAHRS